MKKISEILYLFFFMFCSLSLFSQEIVSSLQGNAVAEKYYQQEISRKAGLQADTLELPFIDDFSDSYITPKPSLWSDNFAFINSTYAIYPPTIGVATLDALNFDGSHYPAAGYIPYQADYLTSQAINMNYPASDSLYLSFYYQPGGLAWIPGVQDSLILDFYSPDSLTWEKIWASPGSGNHAKFSRTMIKIDNPKYLQKGFRFRFRNLASQLENPDLYDKRANVDIWNIDYVKLDKNRYFADTILRDVAFVEPIGTILKDYISIPWLHFESAYFTQRAPFIEAVIENHDSLSRNVGTILEIRDLLRSKPVYRLPTVNAFNFDIPSGDSIHYKYSYNYNFDVTSNESGAFEIKTILKTDAFDFKANDTLIHNQLFYDYYALDDGTAEASYGLRGSGTKDASSAIKFNAFLGDTLRAIDIYFVQVVDSLNLGYYFYLNAWSDNNGKPGIKLVNQIGARPEYADKLNAFRRYQLETPVYIKGNFYVGFTQTVEKLINIGLDMNHPNQPRIFNNIDNGTWATTVTLPGTPMIRPVFGKKYILGTDLHSINPMLTVWPNPANETINFDVDDKYSLSALAKVELIDITGRILKTADPFYENSIPVSNLRSGMYFLRLRGTSPEKSNTIKIIISH